MKRDQAAVIATQALIWLADDAELMGVFLGATGADVADIRNQAKDPEFLGFVLDFILAADEHVLAFAAAHDLPPETVATARAALPGGQLPNWT